MGLKEGPEKERNEDIESGNGEGCDLFDLDDLGNVNLS